MIYYNVTSQIDINIEAEWVRWMQEEHIPEMLNTKYFIEVKLLKINLDDKSTCTYAAQYLSSSESSLNKYINNNDNILKEKTIKNFGDKVLSFSTKLKVISEHK